MAPGAALTKVFSFLTLLTHLAFALLVALGIYKALSKREPVFFGRAREFLRENGLLLAFLVASAATVGSLYFSEVAGFEACSLCWYQRIFLFPQALLLGVALVKDDRGVADYILPLGAVGGSISLYHDYLQRAAGSSACPAGSASCAVRYVLDFGYITIPLMALTAFALIIFLARLSRPL